MTQRTCVRRRSLTLGGSQRTLQVRVEVRRESAVKTGINPSFQSVYRLPARPRENKLRTVNAPIKAGLYALLAHTIHAFTLC